MQARPRQGGGGWPGTDFDILTVNALALDRVRPSRLYIGGRFAADMSTTPPTPLSYISVWDAAACSLSNLPDASFGVNGDVNALVISSSNILYVTGDFNAVGTRTVNNIALWDGTSWLPLDDGSGTPGLGNPYAPQSVWALVGDPNDSNKVWVAGSFQMAGASLPVPRLAVWDLVARNWTKGFTNATSPYFPGNINTLGVYNKTVILGQGYTPEGANLASITVQASDVGDDAYTLWNGRVACTASSPDGKILAVGGDFDTIKSGSRPAGYLSSRQVLFNGTTLYRVSDWHFPGAVRSLAYSPTTGNLFVCGVFSQMDMPNGTTSTAHSYMEVPPKTSTSLGLPPRARNPLHAPLGPTEPRAIGLTMRNVCSQPFAA
jgi:hypothetical protein